MALIYLWIKPNRQKEQKKYDKLPADWRYLILIRFHEQRFHIITASNWKRTIFQMNESLGIICLRNVIDDHMHGYCNETNIVADIGFQWQTKE